MPEPGRGAGASVRRCGRNRIGHVGARGAVAGEEWFNSRMRLGGGAIALSRTRASRALCAAGLVAAVLFFALLTVAASARRARDRPLAAFAGEPPAAPPGAEDHPELQRQPARKLRDCGQYVAHVSRQRGHTAPAPGAATPAPGGGAVPEQEQQRRGHEVRQRRCIERTLQLEHGDADPARGRARRAGLPLLGRRSRARSEQRRRGRRAGRRDAVGPSSRTRPARTTTGRRR